MHKLPNLHLNQLAMEFHPQSLWINLPRYVTMLDFFLYLLEVGRYLMLLVTSGSGFEDKLEAKNLWLWGFESFYDKRTFGLGNSKKFKDPVVLMKGLAKKRRLFRRLFDWVVLFWEIKSGYMKIWEPGL